MNVTSMNRTLSRIVKITVNIPTIEIHLEMKYEIVLCKFLLTQP